MYVQRQIIVAYNRLILDVIFYNGNVETARLVSATYSSADYVCVDAALQKSSLLLYEEYYTWTRCPRLSPLE